MIESFFTALALIFVFEGIFPFTSPESFKHLLEKIAKLDEAVIRWVGFLSMLLGLFLLYLTHGYFS